MPNPQRSDKRNRAIELLTTGEADSIKDAARKVGVSDTTVRKDLVERAETARQQGFSAEDVQEGLRLIREELWLRVVQRILGEVTVAPLNQVRDSLVSYGIADDKLMGRGNGSNATAVSATQVIRPSGLMTPHAFDMPVTIFTTLRIIHSRARDCQSP